MLSSRPKNHAVTVVDGNLERIEVLRLGYLFRVSVPFGAILAPFSLRLPFWEIPLCCPVLIH